jgi:glycolate oxidase subunit GlcD
MKVDTSQERQMREAMPGGRLLVSPAQLTGYESDGLGYKRFRPDAVAIPANSDEVIALVKLLRNWKIPYVARGAGTSLSGGPVAAQGGVLIHLSKLCGIQEINTTDGYAVVESGVVLNRLDEALKPLGLYYPPDPSTGPVCTLGGNVATNAGGVHCFRYGVTCNYVLGAEVILMDGQVVRFGGPAGGRGAWRNDWKRLFVGSEGTLGIFTRFWLRLIPRPEKVWTFRATYADFEQASQAIRQLARHASYPAAIEFMDPPCVDMVENSPMRVGLPMGSYMILTEIDGPAGLVDARVDAVAQVLRDCGSTDVTYSSEESERMALWKARKAQGGLLGQISPDFVVQDAVIPKARLGEMLELIYSEARIAGIAAVTIMHAGDGNLHPDFMFDSRKQGDLEKIEKIGKVLMKKVSELGGALSGEHGIGNDKSSYMAAHFGQLGQAMQMAVPVLFNPSHQLNPLKVFPERRFTTC